MGGRIRSDWQYRIQKLSQSGPPLRRLSHPLTTPPPRSRKVERAYQSCHTPYRKRRTGTRVTARPRKLDSREGEVGLRVQLICGRQSDVEIYIVRTGDQLRMGAYGRVEEESIC